jgi:murein DD-endopeptidase MepM/ murein hydrolase activator NlpD
MKNMAEKNFPELKSNNVIYTLAIGLLLLMIFLGYMSLRTQKTIEQDGQSVEVNFTSKDQLNKIEEELQNSNPLNPEFVISDGDTLSSILSEAKISNNEASSIIDTFSKKFNPRKLSIGTVINLDFSKNSAGNLLLNNMVVTISNNRRIEVSRNINGDFSALEVLIPLIRKVEHRSGDIKNSFTATALSLSIPANAIIGMVRAFSYDVDFQRDIKHGDKLEVVMDKFYTNDGKISHTGDVLYASLALSGKKISIYLYTDSNGEVAYYNEKGESIKKELLRTPLNAAKISSKFGMRNHPVLGYTRMHKGVDFAAPVGTPILAAGSGTVEVATRFGQYGKYVRIKHNSSYSTAYAHISRFANGIKPGYKVKQGQVIAYVGTTGVTSGPHLHYEVLERGKQINPLKFKSAANSDKLLGKNLDQFKKTKKQIEKYLAS